MKSKAETSIKSLYHYCSTDVFLSILTKKSFWLSDVSKSNDKNEMCMFRNRFYNYVYEKFLSLNEGPEKECCRFLLATAKTDGFNKIPDTLTREDLAEELINNYKGMRAYCFCLSEKKDSLGQWRGYADNGNGLAIGFSKEYLEKINSNTVFCPISNFHIWNVFYSNEEKWLEKICKTIYDNVNKEKPPAFLWEVLNNVFYFSTIIKDKSFKEEKEWRVIFTLNDNNLRKEFLDFSLFDKKATQSYKELFETPKMQYTTRSNDIVSHIEVGIKDLKSAINQIIIGPKSNLTKNDIKHILISNGIISNANDNSIKITKSESSYR